MIVRFEISCMIALAVPWGREQCKLGKSHECGKSPCTGLDLCGLLHLYDSVAVAGCCCMEGFMIHIHFKHTHHSAEAAAAFRPE